MRPIAERAKRKAEEATEHREKTDADLIDAQRQAEQARQAERDAHAEASRTA